MFGYVTVNKPELKIKDFQTYQAYYCGLCKSLKRQYGILGQMTLTYDMTFLVILLTSLYENRTDHEIRRCMVHPVKKRDILVNEVTEYGAAMNIVLSYHHFLDDWQDERKLSSVSAAAVLKRKYQEIEKSCQRQCRVIKDKLDQLYRFEKSNENNMDLVSRCFGELMAEIFVWKQDEWEPVLRRMGFFLGKFIYILDAYHDLDMDRKKGNYNPLSAVKDREDFEAYCRMLLEMMMTEAAKEFEKLPCIRDAEILRNILYAGVWSKYDKIQKEKIKIGKEE